MDRKSFHEKILRTIDECSYPFIVIHSMKDYKCPCTEHSTKQPDSSCKLCLGTGYKIRIRRMYGASGDEMKGGTNLTASSSTIIKNYYIPKQYKIYEDDIIVDENDIYYVFRVKNLKGLKGEYTHQEVICSKKKNDTGIFIKNFNEIIANYYKKKQNK